MDSSEIRRCFEDDMSDTDDDGVIPDEDYSDIDVNALEYDSDSDVSLLDFSARKCVVCNKGTNKGRTRFWCPGCNCGVHRECFSRLERYWRPLRGEKRQLDENSD